MTEFIDPELSILLGEKITIVNGYAKWKCVRCHKYIVAPDNSPGAYLDVIISHYNECKYIQKEEEE